MIFPGASREIRICSRCQEECVAWISFEATLQGKPVICERCFAHALGLKGQAWTLYVQDWLKEARRRKTEKPQSWLERWGLHRHVSTST